jgi:hypothetical protein
MNEKALQATADYVHANLKRFYKSWEDLKKVAANHGYALNDETGKVEEDGKERPQ